MPAIKLPASAPLPAPNAAGLVTLPALSIRQPWAWGIAAGFKTVENRTWRTEYRGPIAIHAASAKLRGVSKGWEANDLPNGEKCGDAYVFSAIIAVADVIDCVDLADLPEEYREAPHEDFDPCGPVCWVLANVRRLAVPVPMGGKLSLWKAVVPAAALANEWTPKLVTKGGAKAELKGTKK